jgi:hypothetical protein
MSHSEVMRWMEYRERSGPFNPMLRLDAAIARAVGPFLKGDKRALMPWPKEPDTPASLDDVLGILKFSSKAKKPEKNVGG